MPKQGTTSHLSVHELLDAWAAKYAVESVLERATGDTDAVCAGLAGRGAKVVALVDGEDDMRRMRAAYPGGEVRLAIDAGDDEKHDMVVVHGPSVDAAELPRLAKRAVKLVVVIAPNPKGIAARLGRAPRAWGATEELAPLLWSFGRVREHAWIESPSIAEGHPRLTRALARRHVFVVDVTPRSPQARRKLRLTATE